MTRTIKSETNNNHYYMLTIDETTGQATDCGCNDQYFRCHVKGNPAHQCKHIKHYNVAYQQTVDFTAQVARYDVRSQAVVEQKRAAYFYYEMALGA